MIQGLGRANPELFMKSLKLKTETETSEQIDKAIQRKPFIFWMDIFGVS